MATGEHVTEWSTTAACTPAGSDSIGSTLDDEILQLKATLYKTDRADIDSTSGAKTSSISDFAQLITVVPSVSTLTVSLAAAATLGLGWRTTIQHGGTAQGVLIDGTGTETVGGSITYSLTTPGETVEVVSNGTDGFEIANGYVPIAARGVPSGTKMLFQQTAAPTGWTKVTGSGDNHGLRVTTGTVGSGGATGFTSVFGSGKTTGSTTLTESQIPGHTHDGSGMSASSAGNHSHTVATRVSPSGGSSLYHGVAASSSSSRSTNTTGAHTHTITGNTGSTGGGTGHTHTLSLDVQYLDVIVATKD